MELFKKKLDKEKDFLRVEFDLNSKKYVFYCGADLVTYDDLNRKTKKMLDKKNKLLETDFELLTKELEMAKLKKRAVKLNSLGFPLGSFQMLGAAGGTMSKQMERLLNNLLSEEDVLLGVHRIGSDDSVKKIEDILNNGLKITGHLGGTVQSPRELENNVSYYADNKIILTELMYADAYKNSKGSILIRIPDSDLKSGIFYIDGNGETRLDPKYIVGYVPLEENHHIETIITSDQFKKKDDDYRSCLLGESFEKEYYQEEGRHKRGR